jgi:hypothetical protein
MDLHLLGSPFGRLKIYYAQDLLNGYAMLAGFAITFKKKLYIFTSYLLS